MRTLVAEELWDTANEDVLEASSVYLTEQLGEDMLSDLEASERDVYAVRFGEGFMQLQVGTYVGDDLVTEWITHATSTPPPPIVLSFVVSEAAS